jgi:hypothetical protein
VALVGCAHAPPLVYHETVVPPRLIESACGLQMGGPATTWRTDGIHSTHWDGRANWIEDSAGDIAGIECNAISFEDGWPETVTLRVYYPDWIGTPLEQFLDAIDKLPTRSPSQQAAASQEQQHDRSTP